jgi:RHS repeat-associated protein
MTAGGEKQDRQPYKYGNKELDEMNGLNLYDFLARGYDPAIGRFMSIDPLAEKYYSISPYAYCANNPVNNIDPTGMDYLYANDDTYIGQDDKESDYIRIVNNHMEQIINLTSSKSSGKVTAEMLGKLESVGIGDADLNGKSYSKIFTDILSKMSDVDATAELFNKKMSVAVFGDDGKLEERYNSAVTEYNQNASHYGENGKSLVTATIKTGAENNNLFLYSTVSNVQNMLGVHELIGHGLNGLGSRTRTHHQVYELQMNHSTWTNTTPAFKAIMATLYQRYLISEPK